MPKEFHMSRRVEFSDTDAAGILHFRNYFRYMEECECAFLRSLGFSVMMHDVDPPISWPRASASCDYYRPSRFEDILDIRLRVLERGEKHIVYEYHFSRDGKKLALGRTKVVCCEVINATIRSIPIPRHIADAIGAYVFSEESTPANH